MFNTHLSFNIIHHVKRVFIMLAVLPVSIYSYAIEWESLVGRSIIITETDVMLSPYVYTAACLPKYKFKTDYLADASIVNKQLTVNDVVLRSETDKQKANLNIVVTCDNETYVIHFPLASPYGNEIPFYFGKSALLNLHTPFGNKLTNCCSASNVHLSFIDLALIEEINSKYKNYIIKKDKQFINLAFDEASNSFVATFVNRKDSTTKTEYISSNESLIKLKQDLSEGVLYEEPIENADGNVIRF